jgi:propionyl-CoA carboxylase beta chain
MRELLVPAAEQHGRAAAAAHRSVGPLRIPRSTALIPEDPNKPYDMKKVIHAVVDDGTSSRSTSTTPRNIVVGFARFGGQKRGHRGQSAGGSGRLPRHRRVGQGRALRALLRRFNIPLVTFEDVPGFLPGTSQEYGGIIKHGAKLLYAYAEATVPKITVITRKAYGGAYCVMSSKHIRTDLQLRLPHRRDRGDGPRGRGEHALPRRDERFGGEPEQTRQALVASTATSSPTPTRRPSWATSTR